MRTWVSAISGAALVAALLPGCGGGHGTSTSTTTARAPSSATSPAAPSATTTTPATPPPADAYWPYAKLVQRLAGWTLALPRGPVQLNSALIECNGEGTPEMTGATRRWSRYTCTQTLFQGGVDNDVTFDVTILNATQLSITSPRYGPG